MPFSDPEQKLAYQREWYAKNRQKVIGWVAKRKRTDYAGICENCGGPTVGSSKGKAPSFCGKPECARAQRIGRVQTPGLPLKGEEHGRKPRRSRSD